MAVQGFGSSWTINIRADNSRDIDNPTDQQVSIIL